jgi:hypothetical protein
MGRQKRDGSHSLPLNKLHRNEENGYPVTDSKRKQKQR